jgi:uncharacterized protein with HEPN domain
MFLLWHDILIQLPKEQVVKNLNNQIHFRNILSLLNNVEDNVSHIGFEDYLHDEELRMDLFRQLMLIGIEAFNIRGTTRCSTETEILSSFMQADFLNGFGKEHYAVWNFLKRDLPHLKSLISNTYLAAGRNTIPDFAA